MKKYKGITTIQTTLVIGVIVVGCVIAGTTLTKKYPDAVDIISKKIEKLFGINFSSKNENQENYIPPFVLQPREKIDYVDIYGDGLDINIGISILPDSIAKDPEKLKRFWKAYGKIMLANLKNSLNPFDKIKKATLEYRLQLIADFVSRLQVGENDVCGSKGSEWIPEFFPNGCANHDNNYDVYGMSKSEADFNFYMDMLETAANSDFPLAAAAMANIYYHVVANVDATWDAYVDAQYAAYKKKYPTSKSTIENPYGSGATCSIM